MDFFMGIKGKNFVLVCTDTSAVHSIITIKQDEDKIIPVDSHKVFCIAGEAGDRVQFSDYIIANVKLYGLRNSTGLSTRSVANYTRGELATALRKASVEVNEEMGRRGYLCYVCKLAMLPGSLRRIATAVS
jgi:20S proteasome subunit beta 4